MIHKLDIKIFFSSICFWLILIASSHAGSVSYVVDQNWDGLVERTLEGRYRISWHGLNITPLDIFVAYKPDASLKEMHQLAWHYDDKIFEVNLSESERPYFYIKPLKGEAFWVAERALPLERGRNFRDLGGYKVKDNRKIRWGKIYRSGALANLSAVDHKYLNKLGIRSVVDFRTNKERMIEPNEWIDEAQTDYWFRDYTTSGAELVSLFDKHSTSEDARRQMIALYRKLPFEQVPAYRAMFHHMVTGGLPLMFNCSVGKDRTGLAAALILTALGASKEVIMADYRLTNLYLIEALTRDGAYDSSIALLPKEVSDALLAADPIYLLSAFNEIEKQYGSIDEYLSKELELTEEKKTVLKNLLLE